MTTSRPAWADIAEGDELRPLEVDVTATHIVAGALATRDFMPVHHDRDYANSQGAPDIFMNILSSNAYCCRFLTDWAGPEAMIRRLDVRLGVPVFPGDRLSLTGTVTSLERDGGSGLVGVELRAATPLGDHLTGTALVDLPLVGPPQMGLHLESPAVDPPLVDLHPESPAP